MKLERYSGDAVGAGSILVHTTDFVVTVYTRPKNPPTVVKRSGVSTIVDFGTATIWLSERAVKVLEVENEA